MSHSGNPEKAKRYLSLLDEARCNGNWNEIQELTRKVGKHAPWRKCLTLTALAESEMALSTAAQRPSTASSLPNRSSRPALRQAIENETTYPEDAYQAKVCLAAGFLGTGEKESAVAVLPDSLPAVKDKNGVEQRQDYQGWTYICSIKAAFLNDLCHGASSSTEMNSQDILEHLKAIPTHIRKTSEYHFWTEKLILRLCNSQTKRLRPQSSGPRDVEAELAPFRAWATFWEDQPGGGITSERIPELDGKRRQIWWEYYKMISQLLREGYVFPQPDSEEDAAHMHNPKMAQSSEIRRVEAIYERLLQRDVSFPEASQVNVEVDDWVDQLMANWSVTCGSSWQDEDLGVGGQESASRNVLDFLYRAATRTFQSNTVLRHLITVHASVGELHLSARALDSYVDIVTKGRSRAEKSGKPEPGLDTDQAMLETISNGIIMLCRYGQRKEILRAEELAGYLQTWLTSHAETSDGVRPDITAEVHNTSRVSSEGIGLAYQAIAISKASWARYNLESTRRSELLATATHHLRQALMVDPSNEDNPSILYALSLVLAETRDIDGAIATMKHALGTQMSNVEEAARDNTDLGKRHKRVLAKVGLTQCWHLIALLLSSRQDFEKAEACCETAAHMFDDDIRLPGELELRNLSILERQHIVEAKITSMALSEITDGPDVAVNAGGELLELYSKIFESPEAVVLSSSHQSDRPPKSSAGHRSLRESIFGTKRSQRTSIRDGNAANSVQSNNRLSADTTRPPTIAINDTDAIPHSAGSSNHPSRKPSNKLQRRHSHKSLRKSRGDSPARTVSTKKRSGANYDGSAEPTTPTRHRRGSSASQPNDIGGFSEDSLGEEMPPMTALPQINTDGLIDKAPKPQTRSAKPHELSRPIFLVHPPKYSKNIQDRHSLSLLSTIWVFISGLYRRANMLDDANGAVQEAFSLVRKTEALVADDTAGAREFESLSKSGMKSINELYADAYAEQGQILLSQKEPHNAMRKFEEALSLYPDHSKATVELSGILLDIYENKIPLKPKEPHVADDFKTFPTKPDESSIAPLSEINVPAAATPSLPDGSIESFPTFEDEETLTEPKEEIVSRTAPETLDRLSARDRAYGLLSSLTKLGTDWDNSEAWFALARAYEQSGQPERAAELLWWVVELEEKKPVRSWRVLGQGYSV